MGGGPAQARAGGTGKRQNPHGMRVEETFRTVGRAYLFVREDMSMNRKHASTRFRRYPYNDVQSRTRCEFFPRSSGQVLHRFGRREFPKFHRMMLFSRLKQDALQFQGIEWLG